MSNFIDQALPLNIHSFPIVVPRFRTSIQVTAGGNERRNQEWEHPLHSFTLPEAIGRKWDRLDILTKHFRVMRGPFHSWPFRDPFDFASCDLVKPNLTPTVAMTDQLIGVTDGFTDRFQLVKKYELGAQSYTRNIYHPVLASVLVAVNGVLVNAADYTVSRTTGEVLFDVPPPTPGQDVTAGFLFDNEVRYESDDTLEQIMRATKAGGFGDLTLVEVRPC